MTEISIFSNSQFFLHFSRIFTDFVYWNFGKGQQKRSCCPVGFSEELISVLLVKMSQIDIENKKNMLFC